MPHFSRENRLLSTSPELQVPMAYRSDREGKLDFLSKYVAFDYGERCLTFTRLRTRRNPREKIAQKRNDLY